MEISSEMIEEMKKVIRIPSVMADPEDGAPFGKNVRRCLDTFLEIGEEMGFRTRNIDGYVGELEIGSGDKMIGALAHTDVVAAGEGWDFNPFDPYIEDGKIFGRGSSDDKGPIIVLLHTVRALYDNGEIPDDVRIRIILGTNEEEDWLDMDYYLSKTDEFPLWSIVPDAQFPLVYCEKGLYDFDLVYSQEEGMQHDLVLKNFQSGTARNAVPAKAEAVVKVNKGSIEKIAKILEDARQELGYDGMITTEERCILLQIQGKPAHAMNPEKGINAGACLIKLLNALSDFDFSHNRFTKEYCERIGEDWFAEKMGFSGYDEESGRMTFSIGMFGEKENGSIEMQVSVRYPASYHFETVESEVRSALDNDFTSLRFVNHMAPIYFRKEDDFIQLLLSAFRKTCGYEDYEPVSLGGATYARAIPNAVGFGPLMPDEEELAHCPNEFASLETLALAGDTYYEALKNLCDRVHTGEMLD